MIRLENMAFVILLLSEAALFGLKCSFSSAVLREARMGSSLVRSGAFIKADCVYLLFSMLFVMILKEPCEPIRIMDLHATFFLLAVIDFRKKIVPDEMVVFFLIGQLLYSVIIDPPEELLFRAATGMVFSAILFLASLVARDYIGFGDIKLLCAMAISTGWVYTLKLLCTGLFLSGICGIGLVCAKKCSLRSTLPFIPFLTIGMYFITAFSKLKS